MPPLQILSNPRAAMKLELLQTPTCQHPYLPRHPSNIFPSNSHLLAVTKNSPLSRKLTMIGSTSATTPSLSWRRATCASSKSRSSPARSALSPTTQPHVGTASIKDPTTEAHTPPLPSLDPPSLQRTGMLNKAVSQILAASLSLGLVLSQPLSPALALLDPTGSMEMEVEMLGGYMRGGWRPDISAEEARDISGVKKEEGEVTNEPQQVHVSLWGPGRMMVTWLTSDKSAPSTLEYGRASGEYQHRLEGTSDSYTYATYKSDLIHHAVLGSEAEPLLPDTEYFYRCSGHSRELSLKTPPASLPLNVAVVGDLGQTGWSVSTLEHIEQQPYDLLILPGDLSYADRFQPRWDTWGMLVEPETSSRPWMTVTGNHEAEWLPFLEPDPWKPYNMRWPNPHAQSPSPSDSNLFYSFETAGVHWLMLCAYDDFTPGSEQYEWLAKDLETVDRSKTPWLVAVLHTPWYNSNYAHRRGGELMRQNLESVLYAAQTDLVLAGHVHAYERSARVYDNKLDPCGIVHIVIGDGGNREGLASRYYEQPEWSVRREASFGHGEIQFNEDGSADWSWHRNDDDQSVRADAVKLYPHKMTAKQVEEAKASGVDIPDDRCPVL